MKFTITIQCENDSFFESPGAEVARILAELASNPALEFATRDTSIQLWDVNGNKVGNAYFV